MKSSIKILQMRKNLLRFHLYCSKELKQVQTEQIYLNNANFISVCLLFMSYGSLGFQTELFTILPGNVSHYIWEILHKRIALPLSVILFCMHQKYDWDIFFP